MKKKYLIALSIIIALGALVWFREPLAKAAGGAFALTTAVDSNTSDGAITSVNDLNYLSPGAGTTTRTYYTGGTDILNIGIFGVASTVATTDLRFTVEFSNSTSSVPSEQLWFPLANENISAASGITGSGTSTVLTRSAKEFIYRPVSTLTHRLATSSAMNDVFALDTTFGTSFKLTDITARWTRIVFYIPTTGATLAQSTALDQVPAATSTNAGIAVFPIMKDPL